MDEENNVYRTQSVFTKFLDMFKGAFLSPDTVNNNMHITVEACR